MRRRAIFAILLSGLVALAAAVAPWPLSPDAVRSTISARFNDLYGLDLSVAGRSTIALLPVPRVKFDNVTLTAADGQPAVRSGRLQGELRVLPLLAGRLEFAELSLTGGVIHVESDGGGRMPWDDAAAKLRGRLETGGAGHLKRVVLKGTDVQVRDRRTGFETALRDVSLVATWPSAEAPVDVAGSLTWRGKPVEITASGFRPGAIAAGRPSRVNLLIGAPLARLTLNGDLTWRDVPDLVGRASLQTRSLRDFSRWSGLDLPLGHLLQAFALDGEVHVHGDEISWPAARLIVGGDRLEGALSARHDGERARITGTLAADRLDLTRLVAPLARAPAEGGNPDQIELPGQSGTDLDLRLSAAAVRMGPVRMEDLAANISVKGGRYEASVGHVSINKGVAKGRATLASAADGLEVRGQTSFDRLDLASFLADLGLAPWIGGLAQGQLTFEGAGDTAAAIAGRLHGRANVTVRGGELVAAAVNEAVRRPDGRAAAPSAARGTRMPFEQAQLNVVLSGSPAETANGGPAAANFRAAVNGRASLADRMSPARAGNESGSASGPVVEIAGPWDEVTITPAGRALALEPETTGSGRSSVLTR